MTGGKDSEASPVGTAHKAFVRAASSSEQSPSIGATPAGNKMKTSIAPQTTAASGGQQCTGEFRGSKITLSVHVRWSLSLPALSAPCRMPRGGLWSTSRVVWRRRVPCHRREPQQPDAWLPQRPTAWPREAPQHLAPILQHPNRGRIERRWKRYKVGVPFRADVLQRHEAERVVAHRR